MWTIDPTAVPAPDSLLRGDIVPPAAPADAAVVWWGVTRPGWSLPEHRFAATWLTALQLHRGDGDEYAGTIGASRIHVVDVEAAVAEQHPVGEAVPGSQAYVADTLDAAFDELSDLVSIPSGPLAFVDEVVLAPAWRGRRLGPALVASALRGPAASATWAVLWVAERAPEPAQAIARAWASIGFRRLADHPSLMAADLADDTTAGAVSWASETLPDLLAGDAGPASSGT